MENGTAPHLAGRTVIWGRMRLGLFVIFSANFSVNFSVNFLPPLAITNRPGGWRWRWKHPHPIDVVPQNGVFPGAWFFRPLPFPLADFPPVSSRPTAHTPHRRARQKMPFLRHQKLGSQKCTHVKRWQVSTGIFHLALRTISRVRRIPAEMSCRYFGGCFFCFVR